jgi:predicted nucleic acid-binding protein
MILVDTDVISNFQTAGELHLMIRIGEERLGVAYEVLGELEEWTEHGGAARAILDRAVEEGLMTNVRLERQEFGLYAELRRRLGSGEAASIAIAVKRGYGVATDDGAAQKICSTVRPPVRALSTESLLQHAVVHGHLDGDTARMIWARMGIDDPGREVRFYESLK